MKKITALIFSSCLMALSMRADVLMQDTFAYTNGPIADVSTNVVAGVMVTNWFTHSGNDDTFVNNHRLEVSSSSTYLGVTATRTGDVHRFVTNNVVTGTTHQQLFASLDRKSTRLNSSHRCISY